MTLALHVFSGDGTTANAGIAPIRGWRVMAALTRTSVLDVFSSTDAITGWVRSCFVVAIIWLIVSPLAFAADDPIFDVDALTSTPLNAKTLKIVERDGIVTEDVRFHSETDGDKEVEIFAYFSYPKGATRLPAFIWNPGGLGQANPQYTEVPARRGYAVLCIDFPQPGYRSTGDYPINQGLELGDDPKNAPIYHGAVALLKAVSYLQSRPEVDSERIGMAGASWGGFFTTLMVGIDSRIKVGSCLYGTGSLQLGNAWWDGVSQNGRTVPTAALRERWSVTLDPAWRLQNRRTPIAWFTTTNDAFYSMPAIMKTISMCAGPTHLTLLPNWDHAMPPKFVNEHVYDWLDVHLRGKPAFTKVTPVTVRRDGGALIAEWEFQGDAESADLIVSYGESGNWRHRYWFTLPAMITDHKCSVPFPAGALPIFVSGAVVSAGGIRTSTSLLRVDSHEFDVRAAVPCPDYNGCGEWGGFEENQITFLARHNSGGQVRWMPKLSTDSKAGKFSAVLNADRTILPPILYTADVPHRFSCFLKAETPTTVTVQLAGEMKQFLIPTEWTAVTMNVTPPNTVMGGIGASIAIPPKAQVLIDEISFRPIYDGKN